MTLHLLLRVLSIAIVVAAAVYLPRWHGTLSLKQAYSTHDALAGEHGFDRVAYAVIFLLAYGFLIFLAIKLTPLFRQGEVLFWSLIAGALISVAAVTFWPKKREPWEWHDHE